MAKAWTVLVAACAMAPLSPASGQHMGHADAAAPQSPMLLDGYGNGGFPIRTTAPKAQAFFNNGMELAAAFAHKAAVEAMKEAVRLDPQCVMCAWGLAWTSGPTINYEIEGDDLKTAQVLAHKADRLARRKGTRLERALTRAIVSRYRQGGGDGKPGDRAFARAMDRIARENPQSDALATLAADAWMQAANSEDEANWQAHSARAAALLEPVLARNPDFTPAIHFYIHSSEEAGFGARAEPYADRLGALAPKSQHLVHMPSHTFYWVGRYADAAKVNRQAVEIGLAQTKMMGGSPPEGVFGLPYHAHNVTFGLGGALMAGDADTALWLGRPLVEKSTQDTKASPFQQALGGSGYVALALFAPASEVLAAPAPKLPYLMGMWHYARAEAYARSGDAAHAKIEGDAITIPPGESKEDRSWHGAQTLRIAKAVIEGRVAMAERRLQDAIGAYQRGAELQEQHAYSKAADPPLWWFPVRRELAEAKLAAGDRAGARAEAEQTLKVRPKDPGALALLARLDAGHAAR